MALDDIQQRLQENVNHIADTYNNPDEYKDVELDGNDEDDDCDDDVELDGNDEDGNEFDDVLDIVYMVGSDGEVRGVELLVGFGGPNLYVDTRAEIVKGYWGGNYATANLYSEAAERINDYFAELFECR